jgi:hypothetical protein
VKRVYGWSRFDAGLAIFGRLFVSSVLLSVILKLGPPHFLAKRFADVVVCAVGPIAAAVLIKLPRPFIRGLQGL